MSDSNSVNKVFRGAAIILLVKVLAKCSAFVTEAVLAAKLGTSAQSDAYYMVSSIQSVIYPMLSVGIWRVFLPAYKSHISTDNRQEAFSLANKVITLFTLISAAVTLLVFLFSDSVVGFIAPGFQGETKELCSRLVRLSSPLYIFVIVSAVYAAMLQCHGKFLGSQIREVASHVPPIFTALVFYRLYGTEALAIALVFGAIFRLLVELPFVDWGYRYKPDFHFRGEELRVMTKRLPSALLSEGVSKINTLIDKNMASALPTGAVSALSYGSRLNHVFSGLFSSAISTALYPQIVEHLALGEKDELKKLVSRIINLYSFVIIPVTLGCVLFSQELVTVVYARGAFREESVAITSGIFACYAICLFSGACGSIFKDLFYGSGDTKTPMIVSVIHLAANVIGNLILIRAMGAPGLALATSVSSYVSLLVLSQLAKRIIVLPLSSMIREALKILLLAVPSCFLPRLLCNYLSLRPILTLMLGGSLGVGLYLVLGKLFRLSELGELLKFVEEKLRKKKK